MEAGICEPAGAEETEMRCRDCAEGKPIGGDGILCIQYGIIIGADHECKLKGGRRREQDDGQRGEIESETGLSEKRGITA